MTSFNAIDAALAAVVLLSVWSGWRRGFVLTSLQLLTLALSLLLAFVGYTGLTALLEPHLAALGPWLPPLSFVAIYILAQLVLGAIEMALVRAVPRAVHQHRANHALGTLPGAVNGAIHATVVALILLTLPLHERLSAMARESAITGRLSEPAEWLESRLAPVFDPAIRRALQTVTVAPESKALVRLPFKVTAPKPRPDLEARMLALVNEERAAQGLKPLSADPELAEVARAHSRDMFARGYFSHVSPEGQDPFGRMRKADVRFLAAGENLALAQTLPRAHKGLMESPGHRANILRPQFGRLGVGVLDGGMHGLMVTQEFRN